MDPAITRDICFASLHAAGWSVGEVRVLTTTGMVWLVDASKSGHRIEVRVHSQAEAWRVACEQAEALGMLRKT
jgi:hypothetical protein